MLEGGLAVEKKVHIGTDLTVDGNLTVSGTTTTVNTSVLDVEDPNIKVNNGGNQATANSSKSGFEVSMSDATNAIIGYDSTTTSKFKCGESGSEKEIVTISDVQTLTNKFLNGGTASANNKWTVPAATYATLEGLARVAGNVYYATDLNQYYGDDGSNLISLGGAGGGLDVIHSDDFEAGIGNVSTNDAVNFAITAETTNPLAESTCLRITKAASNQQNDYVTLTTITLSEGYDAKEIAVKFMVKTSANYVDEDIEIVAYDKENSAEIKMVPGYLLAGDGSYSGSFQTVVRGGGGSEGQYEIRVKQYSTSALAYTVDIDNFQVIYSAPAYGLPMYSPKASNATLSWTTNTTHTVNESRIGNFLYLEGNITLSGAPDAATLVITLPRTIDTALVDTNTDNTILGDFDYIDGGVRVTNGGKLRYTSSTTLTFTINDTDVTQASPITWASTDEINYRIKVPVAGWGVTAQLSDVDAARPVECIYNRTSAQSVSSGSYETIIFNSLERDSHSAFNTSTGVFTAPYSKTYSIKAVVALTNNSGWADTELAEVTIYKNGTTTIFYHRLMAESAGANKLMSLIATTDVYLLAGETIQIQLYQNSGGAINTEATLGFNRLAITSVQGNQQSMRGERIRAKYNSAAAQQINNSTITIVDFGTKVYDTHSAVTTGASWKFSAPQTDWYSVKVNVTIGDSAWTAGNLITLYIYKNGSEESVFQQEIENSGTFYKGFSMSTDVQLNEGEYLDFRIRQDSGSNLNLAGDANYVDIAISN